MIKFKTTAAELKALARSTPNMKLILNALTEHSEIELLVDGEAVDSIDMCDQLIELKQPDTIEQEN